MYLRSLFMVLTSFFVTMVVGDDSGLNFTVGTLSYGTNL